MSVKGCDCHLCRDERESAGTSPAARKAYLDRITGESARLQERDERLRITEDGHHYDSVSPSADWLTRLGEQEDLVAMLEEDAERAGQRWRVSRTQSPELAERRELDPYQRHLFAERLLAERHHADVTARYAREKAKLDKMLDEYEKATQPIAPSWWRGSFDDTFGRPF